jgi:hypothetical protein
VPTDALERSPVARTASPVTGERTAGSSARVSWRSVALGTAAFWMLLIVAVHRESPRTLVSFHGFVQAAIADRFLQSAPMAFPPENPFFAGHPVSYYWFFQFVSAQIVRLLGTNVFFAMEAVTVAAMGILMVIAVRLGYVLYGSVLTGVLMGYLVVAGTNPLGFVFAIRTVIRHGREVLQDDPTYLWGVVHPIYSLIRFNDFGGLYGPLLNFFLNMTSRPAALAALMAVLFCLERVLRVERRLSWALLGLTVTLTASFSPIMGIAAGGALLVGLAGSWLWERRTRGVSPSLRGKPLMVVFAIVGGIVMAAPTYYHLLLGPSASRVDWVLFSTTGRRNLETITVSVLLLVILAVVGAFRAPQERRPFLRTLLLGALALLAVNAAVLIHHGNESNFFHAAVVLLSVPAAGSIVRREADGQRTIGAGRATGIFLVFLPTLLLLLAAYVQRPPVPLDFGSPRLTRVPPESSLALLYQWIQRKTSPDAVFIVDPRHPPVAVCGNVSEFPAMAGRVIFTEHVQHYLVQPYPDARRRFDIAVRIVSGDEPDPRDRSYVSSLNRPVYVVSYRASNPGISGRMRHLYGVPIFQNGDVSVFKWLN